MAKPPKPGPSMLKVDIDFPAEIRLKINSQKVISAGGRKLARVARKELEQGKSILGSELQRAKPKEGIEPHPGLSASGRLAKSVTFKKGLVRPDRGQDRIRAKAGESAVADAKRKKQGGKKRKHEGSEAGDISRRAGNHYGLMSIHVFERGLDPFETGKPDAVAELMTEAVQKEIDRQAAGDELGLLVELKTIAKGKGKR